MSAARILLTGFGPFGEWKRNPAGEIAEFFSGKTVGGCEVVSAVLPVVYGEDVSRTLSLIAEHGPAAVISLGMAGNRPLLRVERVALNLRDDEAGSGKEERPIIAGGPEAYFSTLPARDMAAGIQAVDLEGGLSYFAGTYLCNHIMYSTLHYFAERDLQTPAGFIHVPRLPEQAEDRPDRKTGMSLDASRKGVLAALEAVAYSLAGGSGGL